MSADVPTFFVRLAISTDVFLRLRGRKRASDVSVWSEERASRRVCSPHATIDRAPQSSRGGRRDDRRRRVGSLQIFARDRWRTVCDDDVGARERGGARGFARGVERDDVTKKHGPIETASAGEARRGARRFRLVYLCLSQRSIEREGAVSAWKRERESLETRAPRRRGRRRSPRLGRRPTCTRVGVFAWRPVAMQRLRRHSRG